jgi:hypothetical protein
LISQSLLPLLRGADGDALPGLGPQLERFAGQVTTIKLLLAPAGADGDGFYYIASWPTVVSSNLEAERARSWPGKASSIAWPRAAAAKCRSR